jgi:hypothetical protein
MRRKIWMGIVLIVATLILAVGLFTGYVEPPSENGFRLIFLENNTVLISDSDVVSYNLTSQEIAITEIASERLVGMGDELYSFTGFLIRIDGEEVYRGVFRSAIMSAIPGSPKICILFPSMVLHSGIENQNGIRMFYPGFEPPNDQPEANAKFSEYFGDANKLIY